MGCMLPGDSRVVIAVQGEGEVANKVSRKGDGTVLR